MSKFLKGDIVVPKESNYVKLAKVVRTDGDKALLSIIKSDKGNKITRNIVRELISIRHAEPEEML